MKIYLYYLIVIIVLPAISLSEKLKVGVYYDGFCSDSKNFFVNQFSNSYVNNQLIDIIDLQLVPYGKGYKTENGFVCEFDSLDQSPCYVNKLHLCVIEKYFIGQSDANKLNTVKFINCTFSHANWQQNANISVEDCLRDIFNADATDILTCAQERGNELLDMANNVTNRLVPNLDYVPWITYTIELRNKSLEEDFYNSVCLRTSCVSSAIGYKLFVGVYYDGFCPDSRNFFIQQLSDGYLNKDLINYIDLQLIPFGKGQKDSTTNQFTCQFDALDQSPCYVDKLHLCAIEKYFAGQVTDASKLSAIRFFNCSFSNPEWRPNVSTVFDLCHRQVFNGESASEIFNCAENRGNDLLEQAFITTSELNPQLDYIPWVTYIIETRDKQLETNFTATVCQRIVNGCSTTESSASTQITFFKVIILVSIITFNLFFSLVY